MNIIINKFIFYLIFCVITSCTLTNPSKIIGQNVPFTKFQALDGTYLVSDELEGKVSVVIFWASWCAYSRPALKRIDTLAQKYSALDDVKFISVSVDKSADFDKLNDTISYLKTERIEYYYSGNDVYDEAYQAFDASLLPHIFVLNLNGKVVAASHSADIIEDYFKLK